MIRRILNIITTIITALAVLLAGSLVLAHVAGGGAYTILSGSMEPDYPVGSLIYVKKVDPATLNEGEVITFAASDDVTVTHRITAISESTIGEGGGDETPVGGDSSGGVLYFTTKGDANTSVDAEPVDSRNILGKPIVTIPYLGHLVQAIRRPPGLYIAVALIIVLLAVSIFTARPKQKNKSAASGRKTKKEAAHEQA